MKTPLRNAITPEQIPTYECSNQSTHPSVLFFPEEWHGWRYWMAMTPYPYNNGGYEDPSILVSQDARRWQAPTGVTNPLTPAPAVGHNCDVELVYDPDADELRLYYVEADDVKQSWVKLLRSADGVHWTGPEVVIHDRERMYGILSPTIQRISNEEWRMWYVDTGDIGYINQCNAVRTRRSTDGLHWSEEETVEDLRQPGYQIWHIEVRREPETGILHALYPAYPDGSNCDYCKLFYAYQKPGALWTIFDGPVMEQGPDGAWDDFCIYRASQLLDRGGDRLRVWYGGKKKSDASWNMGYAEAPYSQFLRDLSNSG